MTFTRIKNCKTYIERLYCQNCDSEMKHTYQKNYTTIPPKYEHFCINCKKIVWISKQPFPRHRLIEEDAEQELE